MKNLGKQPVLVENFLNGVSQNSRTESRVVYEKADGTLEVNWYGGGRREIKRLPDGSFYWRVDVTSIRTSGITDVLNRLGKLSQ